MSLRVGYVLSTDCAKNDAPRVYRCWTARRTRRLRLWMLRVTSGRFALPVPGDAFLLSRWYISNDAYLPTHGRGRNVSVPNGRHLG